MSIDFLMKMTPVLKAPAFDECATDMANPLRIELMKQFSSIMIVCCLLKISVAMSADPLPEKILTHLDLQPFGTRRLTDNQGSGGSGSDMKALPIGINEFGNVKFKVGDKLIQLGSTILEDLPEIAQGIEVGRHLTKIHLLHSTCFGGGRQKQSQWYVEDDTLIGEYRINFEDRTAIIMPIVYGRDVKDWFYAEGDEAPTRSKVVWTGTNERSTEVSKKIRLYGSTWENPWPDKLVTTIDYSAKVFDTGAAPFCVAITVESEPPAK